MHDINELPKWAQDYILSLKNEIILLQQLSEDIICGSPYDPVYDLESEKAHE